MRKRWPTTILLMAAAWGLAPGGCVKTPEGYKPFWVRRPADANPPAEPQPDPEARPAPALGGQTPETAEETNPLRIPNLLLQEEVEELRERNTRLVNEINQLKFVNTRLQERIKDLMPLADERDRLRLKVKELTAEIERLRKAAPTTNPKP